MNKKLPIFFPFFAVFLDSLGSLSTLPVFAKLIFNAEQPLLRNIVVENRPYWVAAIVSAYAFAQLFGAYWFSRISDIWGRKPTLLTILCGIGAGYSLLGLAVYWERVDLVILARLIGGGFGATLPVCQSILADISPPNRRSFYFSILYMASNLGAVMGPVIGSLLCSSFENAYSLSLPFWIVAALMLTHCICIFFLFDTSQTQTQAHITAKNGVKKEKISIKAVLQRPGALIAFSIALTYFVSLSFYNQLYPLFLSRSLYSSPFQVSMLYAYSGICSFVAQKFITQPLSKRYSSNQILPFSLFIVCCAIFLESQIKDLVKLFLIHPLYALFSGLCYSNLINLVAETSDPNYRGQTLGIAQSMYSLTQCTMPFLGSYIAVNSSRMPLLVGAISMMGVILLYHFFYTFNVAKRTQQGF